MDTNKILKKVYKESNLSVRQFANLAKLNKTNNLYAWLRDEKDISPTKLLSILDTLGIKYEIKLEGFED